MCHCMYDYVYTMLYIVLATSFSLAVKYVHLHYNKVLPVNLGRYR